MHWCQPIRKKDHVIKFNYLSVIFVACTLFAENLSPPLFISYKASVSFTQFSDQHDPRHEIAVAA